VTIVVAGTGQMAMELFFRHVGRFCAEIEYDDGRRPWYGHLDEDEDGDEDEAEYDDEFDYDEEYDDNY
jgi:hypothetical protein